MRSRDESARSTRCVPAPVPRLIRNPMRIAARIAQPEIRSFVHLCTTRQMRRSARIPLPPRHESRRRDVERASGMVFAVAGRGTDAQDLLDLLTALELALENTRVDIQRCEMPIRSATRSRRLQQHHACVSTHARRAVRATAGDHGYRCRCFPECEVRAPDAISASCRSRAARQGRPPAASVRVVARRYLPMKKRPKTSCVLQFAGGRRCRTAIALKICLQQRLQFIEGDAAIFCLEHQRVRARR